MRTSPKRSYAKLAAMWSLFPVPARSVGSGSVSSGSACPPSRISCSTRRLALLPMVSSAYLLLEWAREQLSVLGFRSSYRSGRSRPVGAHSCYSTYSAARCLLRRSWAEELPAQHSLS
jgi:hypothetical protein